MVFTEPAPLVAAPSIASMAFLPSIRLPTKGILLTPFISLPVRPNFFSIFSLLPSSSSKDFLMSLCTSICAISPLFISLSIAASSNLPALTAAICFFWISPLSTLNFLVISSDLDISFCMSLDFLKPPSLSNIFAFMSALRVADILFAEFILSCCSLVIPNSVPKSLAIETLSLIASAFCLLISKFWSSICCRALAKSNVSLDGPCSIFSSSGIM